MAPPLWLIVKLKSVGYVMFDVLVLCFTAKRRHRFQYLRMVATSSGWFKNYISKRPYGGVALVADSETKKKKKKSL